MGKAKRKDDKEKRLQKTKRKGKGNKYAQFSKK